MSKIENTDLILEMYNFKKGLKMEQEDVERQVSFHINAMNTPSNTFSKKAIIRSLTEKLNSYTYDKNVVSFLESLDNIIEEDSLFYELEELYKSIEVQNQGSVYSPVLQLILDIINIPNEKEQKAKILTELKLYDWIREVKNFIFKYTTDPLERTNISSDGGKSERVYTIVEKIDNGFLTFIGDRWFRINDILEYAIPADYISDNELLYKMNLLQTAINIGEMDEDLITFKIDEDLSLGIELSTGDLYVNGEKSDSENLQSVFNSPIIPFIRKDMYPVISETLNSREKFVELDIVQKVTNITNPFLTLYPVKLNEKMYIYSVDKRYGKHLYEYDNAIMLVNEVSEQLGYDISDFFKDRFDEDNLIKKELEDSEKLITSQLSEITENIQKIEYSGLINESEELKNAYEILKEEHKTLNDEINTIKTLLINNKYNL